MNEEPTALAYTDFSKPIPILEDEVAERFLRLAEEAEKNAILRKQRKPTKEELKENLLCKKIMYDFNKRELEKLQNEINELEQKLNAEEQEQ